MQPHKAWRRSWDFFFLGGVVDLDDLLFHILLGQAVAGGQQADVVDSGKAGQGMTLGCIVLVDVEVVAGPGEEPDFIAHFFAADVDVKDNCFGGGAGGVFHICQHDCTVIYV